MTLSRSRLGLGLGPTSSSTDGDAFALALLSVDFDFGTLMAKPMQCDSQELVGILVTMVVLQSMLIIIIMFIVHVSCQ